MQSLIHYLKFEHLFCILNIICYCYILQCAVNWVTSDKPLDTKLDDFGDAKRCSAGRLSSGSVIDNLCVCVSACVCVCLRMYAYMCLDTYREKLD